MHGGGISRILLLMPVHIIEMVAVGQLVAGLIADKKFCRRVGGKRSIS
jgi:hypothetical protein